MIDLKNVSKRYGETLAVNSISFEVEEAENLVLLGTSGCGKTTTLKMINRLIEPDRGEIILNGKNIVDQHPESLRRGIGYVMQNIGLFPHYTVEANIAVVPKLLKWDDNKIKNRIEDLMDKLHLPSRYLKLFPNELSGGQQQRVGLARAMAADPPVLLMDEPFGALDNVTRTNIRREFKDLEELKRKTILMVTHDVDEAFDLADRICLMDKGEIVQIGKPKDLLFNPVNDFAKKFLDGQRLALEFKVVKIYDIWDHLPVSTDLNLQPLSTSLSVWDAMQKFRSVSHNKLSFSNSVVVKTASFEELTKAFNQYRNLIKHE